MEKLFELSSISQIHKMIGLKPPNNPLITFIESSQINENSMKDLQNVKILNKLYSISYKTGDECKMVYGRRTYDFDEGSMMFLSPNQSIVPLTDKNSTENSDEGWNLIFHPDLIRRSKQFDRIKSYNFWGYSSNEALHISDDEKQKVKSIAISIKEEFSKNFDDYSNELIISNLDLMLNYCKRFYGRQFQTRFAENRDVVIKLENIINEYFDSGRAATNGIPTVKYCADLVGYSANYLSDLLKKETGKSTKEYIYMNLIDRAKDFLLGSDNTINMIAYSLGFEYPQHFSKLFKNKTGMSPAEYRIS